MDHIVLWVADPVASATFFTDVVGFSAVRLDEFRAGTARFPSVRLSDETILDLMDRRAAPTMNARAGRTAPAASASAGHPVNHICLAMDEADFHALRERLTARGIDTSMTTTNTFGARGDAPQAYFFSDPDGNVFEVRYYPSSSTAVAP